MPFLPLRTLLIVLFLIPPQIAFPDTATHNSSQGPLLVAAKKGDIATIRKLLKGGANPYARDSQGRSAVEYAMISGRKAAQRWGLNAWEAGYPRVRALYQKVMQGMPIDEFRRVLETQSFDLNATAIDPHASTLLMGLLNAHKYAYARILLDAHPLADMGNLKHQTPLMSAAGAPKAYYAKALAIAEVLLRQGAKVELADMKGIRALSYAVRAGNVKMVELLLNHGAVVNAEDPDKATALFYAVGSNSIPITKLLIKHGAHLSQSAKGGLTPLALTIDSNDPDMARLLLAHGADPNAVMDQTTTLCSYVVNMQKMGTSEQIVFLDMLITAGANPDLHSEKLDTALTKAVTMGNQELAQFLLKKGSNPLAIGTNDRTPLYDAILGKDVGMVKALLSVHPNLNDAGYVSVAIRVFSRKPAQGGISWSDKRRELALVKLLVESGASLISTGLLDDPPLGIAALQGNQSLVGYLLAKGAPVNSRDAKTGDTPLIQAVVSGQLAVVKYLLKHHADPNAIADDGESAAHLLAQTRSGVTDATTMAKLLVSYGANLGLEDKHKLNPLAVAVETNNSAGLVALISAGANVDARSGKMKSTPLIISAQAGTPQMTKLLLKYHAKIDARARAGFSALHVAAVTQATKAKGTTNTHKAEVAEILLDHGSNTDSRNDNMATPLMLAAFEDNIPVMRVLLKHGAQLNLVDKHGKTAMDYAMKNKNIWAAAMIKERLNDNTK